MPTPYSEQRNTQANAAGAATVRFTAPGPDMRRIIHQLVLDTSGDSTFSARVSVGGVFFAPLASDSGSISGLRLLGGQELELALTGLEPGAGVTVNAYGDTYGPNEPTPEGPATNIVTPQVPTDLTQLEEKALWVPGIDSVFWPCVSGEDEPPTFGVGAGYSLENGLACVAMFGGDGSVTWPGKPRIREDRPVMRIRFYERTTFIQTIANLTRHRIFQYGKTPKVLLRIRDNNNDANKMLQFETTDVGGTTQTTAFASSGVPRDTGWHYFELRLFDTKVELYMDTLLKITHSTRFWPSTVGASSYALTYLGSDPTNPDGHLSQLSVQWEKESWL